VSAYIREYRQPAREELDFFRRKKDLQEVVCLAATSRLLEGKKHPHQHRIPDRILKKAAGRLQNEDLGRNRSFEELHQQVEDCIGRIRGIGPLAIYDISLRIGAFLRLAPRKVFLHRGARKGAAALGLRGRKEILDVSELPQEFGPLSPLEIEDCLCIFKKALAQVKPS